MFGIVDKIHAARPATKALHLSNFPVLYEIPAIASRAMGILVVIRANHSISSLVTDACASSAAHGEAS